jgi:cellulose biosynthesis protein BcsQ
VFVPKIVTVAARKGGVGKTTLAYELAWLLDAPLVDLEFDEGSATRMWGGCGFHCLMLWSRDASLGLLPAITSLTWCPATQTLHSTSRTPTRWPTCSCGGQGSGIETSW